jgi:hypothetical protein
MDLTNVTWRKATRSGSNGGDCVELADIPSIVAVRDSKNPNGPALTFSRSAFRALIENLKHD